jgi:D-ribose pyranase
VPTVLQVLGALRPNFVIGRVFAAREFKRHNPASARSALATALQGVPLTFESHVAFKKRVPHAIGLIRTGDTIPYANLILESA